jgi:GT2 family glycosyltransferase
MDLSIGIVSYNCRDLLARCLESIRAHSGQLSVEVIVTDNASTDDTVAMVREHFPEVRLIASRENLGFAAGTNRALAAAAGDVLMMLNPDTEVRPGALEHLVHFLRERPEAGAVGPRMVGPDDRLQLTCHAFPTLWLTLVGQLGLHRAFRGSRVFGASDMTWWAHDQPRRVDWLSGACIATRRETWEHVGPLDEGYFMYFEDVDWCYRLSRAGYERWYLPDATIVHHEAGSWTEAAEERILAAHRAGFRFFGKNYGLPREVLARLLICWGALARGSFWTIFGPVLGAQSELVSGHRTHFRVAELAIRMNETWRRTEGAAQT